jgi:hypothetical protein
MSVGLESSVGRHHEGLDQVRDVDSIRLQPTVADKVTVPHICPSQPMIVTDVEKLVEEHEAIRADPITVRCGERDVDTQMRGEELRIEFFELINGVGVHLGHSRHRGDITSDSSFSNTNSNRNLWQLIDQQRGTLTVSGRDVDAQVSGITIDTPRIGVGMNVFISPEHLAPPSGCDSCRHLSDNKARPLSSLELTPLQEGRVFSSELHELSRTVSPKGMSEKQHLEQHHTQRPEVSCSAMNVTWSEEFWSGI